MTTIPLTIESLAAGGDGVSHDADGRVVFVPHAVPGDRIDARVVSERSSMSRAEVVTVTAASPDRIEAPCGLFRDRTCGGCTWQHIAIGAQRDAKVAIAARALRHFTADGMELAPLVAPVADARWRRRARLHWYRPRKAPEAVVGFYAPGTTRVTGVVECLQVEPAVERALAAIREHLAPSLGRKGEISILAGHRGDVHVAVDGPCDASAAERLVGTAGIVGVSVGKRSWGARFIELEPDLSGRADWFAQASLAGNRALCDVVDRATSVRDGLAVLELFAGSGNFTRVLARGAESVVTVDSRRPPWPVRGARFERGVAAKVVSAMVGAGRTFGLAVLDPPRTGARDLMEPLARLEPQHIVYVSCDPATLARDLAILVELGYRAARATPLDLMPQTAHVEVVVELARATSC